MMIIDEMKLSWSIIIMKVSVHSLRQINVLLPLRTFNRSVIPTCWENRDNSEYNASILIRTELRDNRWQIIFPLCSFSVRKSSLFITCEKVEGISNCMWFSENFIQNKKVVDCWIQLWIQSLSNTREWIIKTNCDWSICMSIKPLLLSNWRV